MKYAQLVEQFKNMRCLPLISYGLSNGEFVEVDLSVDNCGIYFEISYTGDKELDYRFSGLVTNRHGKNFIKWDQYFMTDLDHYLQLIDLEMREGVLIPNGLEEGSA